MPPFDIEMPSGRFGLHLASLAAAQRLASRWALKVGRTGSWGRRCASRARRLVTPRSIDVIAGRTARTDCEQLALPTRREAMARMKAAQVPKAGADFQIVERDIPEPGPGQVRIRVQACGVCHSDVLAKEGGW